MPISVGEQLRLLQQVSCQRISRDLKSGAGHLSAPPGVKRRGKIWDWAGVAGANARCGEVARHISNVYGPTKVVP